MKSNEAIQESVNWDIPLNFNIYIGEVDRKRFTETEKMIQMLKEQEFPKYGKWQIRYTYVNLYLLSL